MIKMLLAVFDFLIMYKSDFRESIIIHQSEPVGGSDVFLEGLLFFSPPNSNVKLQIQSTVFL